MAVRGLGQSRTSYSQVLPVAAAGVGMLLLIGVGALVLFERGALFADFVAVGLGALVTFGLWAFRRCRHNG